MSVQIRSASAEDVGALLELWRAAGAAPGVSDSERGLSLLLERDPHALLVAEADGAVIGSLIAAWDGWRGNLYRLAVSSGHRRRGVASALVREGERRLRDRGAARFSAIVAGDQDGALAFWRARGYSLRADQVRYIRHP